MMFCVLVCVCVRKINSPLIGRCMGVMILVVVDNLVSLQNKYILSPSKENHPLNLGVIEKKGERGGICLC